MRSDRAPQPVPTAAVRRVWLARVIGGESLVDVLVGPEFLELGLARLCVCALREGGLGQRDGVRVSVCVVLRGEAWWRYGSGVVVVEVV